MAKCQDCKQEMTKATSCLITQFTLKTGVKIGRIKYGEGDEKQVITEKSHPQCHDCNVNWGKYHHFGCDMEDCPICGKQLIDCEHGELLTN